MVHIGGVAGEKKWSRAYYPKRETLNADRGKRCPRANITRKSVEGVSRSTAVRRNPWLEGENPFKKRIRCMGGRGCKL